MVNDISFKSSGLYLSEETDLAKLKPVLDVWPKLIETYCRQLLTPSYWSNERANISTLSGAAWQTKGWLALEEYKTEKHKLGEENTKYGRCDLYMAYLDHDTSFAIEAKQAWQNIGRRVKNKTTTSKKTFKSAVDSANKLTKFEAKYRAAACFIVPRITTNELEDDFAIKQHIENWLNEIKVQLKPDVMCWCFPESINNDRLNAIHNEQY